MRCIEILMSVANQPNLKAEEKRKFAILVKAKALRAKVKAKEDFRGAWSTLSQLGKINGC